MAEWTKLRQLVQDMVDRGVTSVEDIHKTIADMPFDRLEEYAPFPSATRAARSVHDRTVGGVYKLIRTINNKAGEMAQELIDGVENVRDDEENY